MRQGRWLGLVLCCGLAGCLTTNPLATPVPDVANPFVENLIKQDPLVFKEGGKEIKLVPPRLKPDLVLQEIPLGTPLANARAVMERHGFSCWSGVQDNYRICLYCTAFAAEWPRFLGCRASVPWRRRIAQPIGAKRQTWPIKSWSSSFTSRERINDVEISVEYDVVRGFWGTF